MTRDPGPYPHRQNRHRAHYCVMVARGDHRNELNEKGGKSPAPGRSVCKAVPIALGRLSTWKWS
jgi:hypothetical protein